MQSKLFDSKKYFNVSYEEGRIICIKIRPIGNSCCLRCKNEAWEQINEYTQSYGKMELVCDNEGFIFVKQNDEQYILETHESGPEIIVAISASLGLITAIVNLIIVIVKAFSNNYLQSLNVNITKKQYKKGMLTENILIKIYSEKCDAKQISKIIEQALKKENDKTK